MKKSDVNFVSGSFELLHQKINSKIKPIDVREFARAIFETSSDPSKDLKRYIELLPKNMQLEIEDRPLVRRELEIKWDRRDISLYHRHDIWYKILTQKMKTIKY